jgi:hypothetical protein
MAEKRNEEHKFRSREKLARIIKKKFETCFIGSINSVEDVLGELWGRDLDRSQRTSEQVRMLKIWLQLRSEILDKGNAQLRGAIKELEDYDIDYRGKRTTFIIGDDE